MAIPEPRPAVTTFAFVGERPGPFLEWYTAHLREQLIAAGCHHCAAPPPDVRLVLNLLDLQRPRPFRRRAQATFVVAVAETDRPPADMLRAGYPLLVRSLSNLLLYVVRTEGGFATHFVTPEQGTYTLPYRPDDDAAHFAAVRDRLMPLATSQLVIHNEFHPDLEPELWQGDEQTRELRWAGQQLAALDLLPAAFPIAELLEPRDLRHVSRLYGIGGLSYGNLSVRKDARRFWMSASGVNKGDMRLVGHDMLLVKGFQPEQKAMLLSVPPRVKPRRVSVDAIEHWMIYTEHPQVGAIVHVHAWMDGVASTHINYPCGTRELARAVADLVRQAPDPSRAVVGLKNHGLTITGRSLADIFQRIDGKIIRQVPMS